MATGSKALVIAKYALLPQVLPRIASLLFSGFDYFAYFMAQVYRGVRLLPASHPYLRPSEIGNFSIPDVIAAAGRNLTYRKENIDQIIIFYVILLGLILLVLQGMLLLVGALAPSAFALSMSYYFGQSLPGGLAGFAQKQDLAFIFLDRVFGVPGIFDSCVSKGGPCYRSGAGMEFLAGDTVYIPPAFPWPFHNALHAMFEFYSIGLLIVGMMIFLYFVLVIVAETAQTGTPFGRRFNRVWAPMRLVMALGLLIPIANGLNTAQYIVLYSAKLGSNFATNGWLTFNSKLTEGKPLDGSDMISMPKPPMPNDLIQFMMLAHACKAVEEGYIKPPFNDHWQDDPKCAAIDTKEQQGTYVNAYLVKATGDVSNDHVALEDTDYDQAMTFFGKGTFTIRVGDVGCLPRHTKSFGHVFPTCGEITMSNTNISTKNKGGYEIQRGYYGLIRYLWGKYGGQKNPSQLPKRWDWEDYCDKDKFNAMMALGGGDINLRKRALYYVQLKCPAPKLNGPNMSPMTKPDVDWLSKTAEDYRVGNKAVPFPGVVASATGIPSGVIVEEILRAALIAERADIAAGKYAIPIDLMSRGWAGAGMWYNQIAQANGAFSGAAQDFPKITAYPNLMSTIMESKLRNMQNINVAEIFSASKSQDSSLQTGRVADAEAIKPMSQLYELWTSVQSQTKPITGNKVYDFLNYLFGTQGLFDLRDPANQNVHPLALLTALGKGLIEASIRNVALGATGQGVQILSSLGGSEMGNALGEAFSGIMYSIATMTLTAGFILYYILPFLPFMYFFFAVGNWVKGIFEAMVGVPLWALAHIRIDGDGLPGGAALNGYFLIFEIFLRPILIVFGLIAAVGIFAAMASTFNAIFPLAVTNLGGIDYSKSADADWLTMARGPVDQLFYTVMYAIILYVMGLACFKLIDLIPNNILRWMGASVQAFADGAGDPASQLTQYAAIGGSQITQQAIGGMKSLGGAGAKLAEGINKSATK